MQDQRIGTFLDDRYRIIERIAAGGMGVVYRGERIKLGRGVAIKFLHAWMAADESFIKRFEIEARAMAKLQHPNCASVIDFGVDGEEPYVVMDLVAGRSLRSLLERERLPVSRALDIIRQVLAGLAHAHKQGITHRDIKPDNIMVDTSPEFGDQVRILDFGLAKMREGATGLTTGFVVGTPDYMAPEQTLAQAVDARTDVYAVGVMLFEMLTGAIPFRAEYASDVMRMHREDTPPRLAERAPEAAFSAELEAVAARALAKAPADRYLSAAEFAAALDTTPEAASTRKSGAMAVSTPAEPAGARAASQSQTMGSADTAMLYSDALLSVQTAAAPADPSISASATVPIPASTHPSMPASAVQPASPSSSLHVEPPGAMYAPAAPAPSGRKRLVAGAALGVVAALVLVAIAAGSSSQEAPAELPAAAQEEDTRQPLAKLAAGSAETHEPGQEASAAADAAVEATVPVPARGDEPPELTAIRPKLKGSDTPRSVVKELHKIGRRYPKNAEIQYILGNLYFSKLWVKDGLEAFREAILLDPAYRSDSALIKSTLNGLGNDKYHYHVRRFLVREVGKPAVPYLQEVLAGSWREQVKDRAATILRELQ